MSPSDPNPNPNDSPSPLALLPEELYLSLLAHLPIPSTLALSQTSKTLNRIANPTASLNLRPKLHDFLISAQAFPRWRGDGLACFVCLKILPRRRFLDGHTRGEWGREGERERERFCVLCGVRTGRLERGSEVWRGMSLCFVCWGCGALKAGWGCVRGGKVCGGCDVDGEVIEDCEGREGIAC